MADEVIGRADYELRAKIDGLKADLTAAEAELAKSGIRGEADFKARSKKWGPAMVEGIRLGTKVVGAGVASMLALASKGAVELQGIQNDFQSETGASAEEAKRAAKAINAAAAENQQSLQAVGAAAIAVHNNLGLVGDQADTVLGQFTKFARVTRQEPVAAVNAFDDILDSWHLTADKIPGLMDKLVASHQKYGGSVAENEVALGKLAPAMQAMGASVDDTIALLNLFAASGLNAADAQGALNHAVAKLKPGQTFNDLVSQVTAIEDPTQRAQKAIEIFGRQGAAMGNVLRPGITGLSDFAVSEQDAADATNKAADALDQGPWAWAQKQMSLLGGAVRDLGGDWGPVVTGLASFATLLGTLGLDKLVVRAWEGVASSVAVKGAIGVAGGAAEAIYTAAAMAVERFATALKATWTAMASSGSVLAAARIAGGAAAEAMAAGALAVPIIIPIAAAQGMHQGANDALGLPEDAGQSDRDKAILDRFHKAMGAAGVSAGAAMGDGLAAGFRDHASTEVVTAWSQIGSDAIGAVRDGAAAAAPRAAASIGNTLAAEMRSHGDAWIKSQHTAGQRAMEAVAQGIAAARAKPLDAFNTLVEMLKHPLSRLKEQSRLLGELTSKELAKGLRSKDPEIRDQAIATKQYILDRLTELKTGSGKLTKEQAALVAKGLKSHDADIRAAALHIKELATKPLVQAKNGAYADGQNIAEQFAKGLASAYALRIAQRAAWLLAHATAEFTHGNSPPPKGPLSTIDKGGRNVGLAWVKGFGSVIPDATRQAAMLSAAVHAALSGAAFSAGAMVPRGMGLAAGIAGGSSATTNHYGGNLSGGLHVHLTGVGSNVSPAAATRFGQQVLDEVVRGFRDQSARTSRVTGGRW